MKMPLLQFLLVFDMCKSFEGKGFVKGILYLYCNEIYLKYRTFNSNPQLPNLIPYPRNTSWGFEPQINSYEAFLGQGIDY